MKSKSSNRPTSARTTPRTSIGTNKIRHLYEDVDGLIKRGLFDDPSLLGKATQLNDSVKDAATVLSDEKSSLHWMYWKARAITYETFDYHNCVSTQQSDDLFRDAMIIVRELPNKIPSGTSQKKQKKGKEQAEIPSSASQKEQEKEEKENEQRERVEVREKVRFCLAGVNELYRQHEYARAKQTVESLYDFTLDKLRTDTFHCYGTLGQLAYVKGKILRQTSHYDEAGDCFLEAIEWYFKRAAAKKDSEEDWSFSSWRIGLCLGLGLGSSNLMRGYLTRAMQSVLPARLMLLKSGGEVNKAYLDIVFAAIDRNLTSKTDDTGRIDEAIKTIEASYKTFQDKQHHRYKSRAAYELSLAYFYKEPLAPEWLAKAEEMLAEVEKFSSDAKDFRWHANALVLRSRVERKKKRYAEAEKSATYAHRLTEGYNLIRCEALIARGEARIDLAKYEDARGDFYSALKINDEHLPARSLEVTNPRISSLCYLNLSYVYAIEKKVQEAGDYFQKWKALERFVEHRGVHHLSQAVEVELKQLSNPFIIQAGKIEDFNYKALLTNLQQWLVEQARHKTQDQSEMAKIIGVSRQTLYQWTKTKRPRRIRSGGTP